MGYAAGGWDPELVRQWTTFNHALTRPTSCRWIFPPAAPAGPRPPPLEGPITVVRQPLLARGRGLLALAARSVASALQLFFLPS